MTFDLAGWIEQTRLRRGEHLPGEAFSSGLLDGAPDRAAARRTMAATLVRLVGDRPASVTFDPGQSYATPAQASVNIDGSFVDAPVERENVEELLAGVAAHEGEHLRSSEPPARGATPLHHWLYNLVEDERIEVDVARRWPALSPALATARRELIRGDLPLVGFLAALFYMVRAPDKLPDALWSEHQRSLEKAMRILTPFPETPADVVRAVRSLRRLAPRDLLRAPLPDFPDLVLERAAPAHVSPGAPLLTRAAWRRFPSADELSASPPAVVWTDAAPDAGNYGTVAASVRAEARTLRAAFLGAVGSTRQPRMRRGVLDRRRLHAWQCDDRLFRARRPALRDVTLALILDLSGSMHGQHRQLQRVAIAISEAARELAHVRLYVYGHDADRSARPATDITRFATPARGPALPLGTLPAGANNRDGHALEVIAGDLAAREPRRGRARLAIHVCDGLPSACGYHGRPAQEATRKGMATFRRTFGPLVLLAVGQETGFEALGTTGVAWKEGEGMAALGRVIAARLAAAPEV